MQEQTRMKSTLVIATSIIAAVRLARDLDISRPSPRLTAVVNESVSLARMILDRIGQWSPRIRAIRPDRSMV